VYDQWAGDVRARNREDGMWSPLSGRHRPRISFLHQQYFEGDTTLAPRIEGIPRKKSLANALSESSASCVR
jgi:hypothetical protein